MLVCNKNVLFNMHGTNVKVTTIRVYLLIHCLGRLSR